jgi:UDP-N-acetylglucosamine 2-epimerase (non-hydrolysing)
MIPLKVMTVIGTRPEIIRSSAIIKRLDQEKAIEHILVHTGQNYDYELNQIFFDDLELRVPDMFLEAAGETALATIGNILTKMEPVLKQYRPDAFLVLGDTNSALSAIAAKKYKIPIFHMEAGNRCFDQRVPEETNRKIVDHIADINLPYSDIAREYLLKEGLPADQIIKTGSPMYEVIQSQLNKIKKSSVLDELKLVKDEYFLVSAHREENVDSLENLGDLVESLNAVADIYQMPIMFSTHPRTLKRLEQSTLKIHSLIQVHKPFNFSDYNHLQMNAKAVLSDSGTISEETSILKLKALNIRTSHERPEAMEEGTVMMVGLKKDNILRGIEILKNHETSRTVKDYEFPNVSNTIVKTIFSYTPYINQKVWRKHL